MKRLLTLLALPFLSFHLYMRFFTSIKMICAEDQRHTAQCRASAFQNTILQFIYFMLWLPEYRSVFLMRCGKMGKVLQYLPLLPQITLYIRTLSKNIEGGMVISHGHSVEINASRIGKNFHCFQNVTIGTTNSPIGPTIGDNVFVGAGAVVLGNIKIGNNVKIGANAIVTQDLPDICTVVTKGTCIVKLSGKRVHIDL